MNSSERLFVKDVMSCLSMSEALSCLEDLCSFGQGPAGAASSCLLSLQG